MVFDTADATNLAAQGKPVLCADTCSILDVIRDPIRDSAQAHDAKAALELVLAMEADSLVGLLARQVKTELSDNTDNVYDASKDALAKFISRVARVDEIAKVFGATQIVSLTHFDGHSSRTKAVFERWTTASIEVAEPADAASLAWGRMIQTRTPAQQGKDSMKDCVVIETYLRAASALRSAGLSSKIVFLSSNTKDYTGKENKGELNNDLAAEFQPLNIEYARGAAHAKHLLGF